MSRVLDDGTYKIPSLNCHVFVDSGKSNCLIGIDYAVGNCQASVEDLLSTIAFFKVSLNLTVQEIVGSMLRSHLQQKEILNE